MENEHSRDVESFFKQLNSFFDRIYVITLKRAVDRQEHIRNELKGLEYEFFSGRDKQEFTIEELKERRIYDPQLARKHHRFNKEMQPGQIGCAWSHAEVYKDVLQKGYKKVLILEDDIVINKAHLSIFNSVLEQLSVNWELLYFGFAEKERKPKLFLLKKLFYHSLRLFRRIRYSHATIRNLYPRKVSQYLHKAGYHDCTHAYAITASAAEKLLNLQQPVSFIADNLLAHAVTNELVNGYIILPRLINQQYQVSISSASYLNE